MVRFVRAPLTRVGFRRDVRLFLTGLTGFLVVLIFILLLLLRANLAHTEEAIDRSHQMIADVSAEAVNRSAPAGLDTEMLVLRGRFNIAGIGLTARNGRTLESGLRDGDFDIVTRLAGPGTLTLRFDASARRTAHRDFLLTAAICILAASLGIALLLFYLPRVTGPIEQMLDDARQLGAPGDQEETAYLIDTFRQSIATLKSQEEELKRLHDREKTRADELERITGALTRSLTSGLIVLDATGAVADINAAGREILGIDATNSVAGRALPDAIPLLRLADKLHEAFEQRAAMNRIEISDVQPDTREPVTIGLTTVPLRNEADALLGFLALFTDLTPIRSLETRVQEMTTLAQLGEISAGIAHEFRSSLSTILGYMKLARKGGVDDVAETRLLNAEKEASLLLKAIERLLAFAGPVQLNAEAIELRGLLGEQIAHITDIEPSISVTLDGPPVVIQGDRVLLSRAIENLLNNAADAVRQNGGGSIAVTLRDKPPSVTIADNGAGFDPADGPRFFLPFQSNKPTGFGMGLPLAKKIVLLHGGTLRLTGEPGKGAVATIELGTAV
ncbi:MAG TPA: ATP-binding protein [Thermoanaerobaculia bacterium]|jgi:signal transduction histidine kinase|nr:ATP-binding protein [Thermoanaerobaculia bacterium]